MSNFNALTDAVADYFQGLEDDAAMVQAAAEKAMSDHEDALQAASYAKRFGSDDGCIDDDANKYKGPCEQRACHGLILAITGCTVGGRDHRGPDRSVAL